MTLRVISPFSGAVVCELALDGPDRLAETIAIARKAQATWRSIPVAERCRRVARGLQYFRDESSALARDITLQMGKPIQQARAEVAGMLQRAEHMIAIAEAELASEMLPALEGMHRRIEHVPMGVVLNLAAWNYPLLIAVNVVVPALLAGNAVLLKHSARTPLCGKAFAAAFGNLEPAGLVQHLVLGHEATAALIQSGSVDHVAFTGSVEGGRAVHRAAADRFFDVGLELGGKDPAYVAADADLERAVAGIVDGACYNAGQSCCAVERVYVHHSLYDAFLERAAQGLEDYVLGDPLDEGTTLGPMVTVQAARFALAQVDDATRRGARLLRGGSTDDERFCPPTLLADCPQDSAVMQEETFGPLLPTLSVGDDDEAIARMNDTRFGLTASVWTRDRARAERFGREIEAGTVYQNRCDALDPALPWTGFKDSGKGVTLSRYGLHSLTRRKAIHFRD